MLEEKVKFLKKTNVKSSQNYLLYNESNSRDLNANLKIYSIDLIVFIVFSTITVSSLYTPPFENEVALDMLLCRWLIESFADGNKTVDIEPLSDMLFEVEYLSYVSFISS